MRQLTFRRGLFALLITVALVVGGCAVVVGATTTYTQRALAYRGEPGLSVPPDWTKPCWRRDHRYRRDYVLPCARVQGVVFYRQVRDPDGDGDVHAVVMAGRHLVTVKSDQTAGPTGGLAGVGHRIDVAGVVEEGRLGLPVVDIRRRNPDR